MDREQRRKEAWDFPAFLGVGDCVASSVELKVQPVARRSKKFMSMEKHGSRLDNGM